MQVKTITALTVAALAEAAAPYGIESFDDVLEPLWKGIRLLRGKVLASFLKVCRPLLLHTHARTSAACGPPVSAAAPQSLCLSRLVQG